MHAQKLSTESINGHQELNTKENQEKRIYGHPDNIVTFSKISKNEREIL